MSNTIIGDMRDYPVQKQPCKTCPFEGFLPSQISAKNMRRYVENLMGQGQHICHSSNNTRVCRGGRNLQLKWLCDIGMLDEPTDEAFDKEVNKAMENKQS